MDQLFSLNGIPSLSDAIRSIDTSPLVVEPPVLPIAYSYSDTQFEILQKHIQEFERSLDADHEVALMLTNFSQTIVMQVTEISYEESVLMIFRGYVNGTMSTLIQHVSQLNFLLTSVPRDPDRPKRQIGFVLPPSDTE